MDQSFFKPYDPKAYVAPLKFDENNKNFEISTKYQKIRHRGTKSQNHKNQIKATRLKQLDNLIGSFMSTLKSPKIRPHQRKQLSQEL